MLPFFKKKVDNFSEAVHYQYNLTLALDNYKYRLLIVDSIDEANTKCEIIREYINFQFPIHCDSVMDKKTVHKIGNMFAEKIQKENKYNITKSEQRKIVSDYFNFIVENYTPKD